MMDAALELEGGILDLDDGMQIDRIGDATAGDADGDSDSLDDAEQQHQFRRDNRQMDMLLDTPHEPPVAAFPVRGGRPVAADGPPRWRKMRSFYTNAKPSPLLRTQQPEMCLLMANVTRAMREVQEDQRGEYFANYLVENMTSQNYPNGEGLPQRWGQF
ncbi:male-specific protein scotti [Drosophila gunungcola]|uniref:male-specific protein scotti n=1 Tax=Drosophila gunungcola TaxID=103775 RepID=UPI0022E5FC5A|nr:male-specific protein scotti [Drosophila gunungcola]